MTENIENCYLTRARLEPVSDSGNEVLAAVSCVLCLVSRVSCPDFIIRLQLAFWYQLHLAIVTTPHKQHISKEDSLSAHDVCLYVK